MQTTIPRPVTQPPVTDPPQNNTNNPFLNLPPLEYIVEALLCVVGLILFIFVFQLFHTSAQKESLKNTGHYIPNRKQYEFINSKGEYLDLWTEELNIINTTKNSEFFSSNESYRFAVIKCGEQWKVTVNNQIKALGVINIEGVEEINDTEYRKYLKALFEKTEQFIVEFRKKSNSIFFYKLKAGLLIDKVFKLKGDDFIGIKIEEYYKTSFENFLINLDTEDKSNEEISLNNLKYKDKLVSLLYFYMNSVFKNSVIQLLKDYLLILDSEFQFILPGNYEPLILLFLEAVHSKNLELIEKFKESAVQEVKEKENKEIKKIEEYFKNPSKNHKIIIQFVNRSTMRLLFFIEGEGITVIHKIQVFIDTKFTEYFKSYVRGLFNKGEMSLVQQIIKCKQSKYQKEWVSILKENEYKITGDIKKKMVESFYNYRTGWDFYDEEVEIKKNRERVSLKDVFKDKTMSEREWIGFLELETYGVE